MTPVEYEQAGGEYPDVYERIHGLAEKTADIRYWASLAKRERKFKAPKDKVPSIDFVPPDDNAGGLQGYEADPEMDEDDEDTGGFSGDIEGSASVHSAGGPQGQMEPAKRHREGSAFKTSKKAKVGQQQPRRPQQEQVSEPNGEEVVDIYIGNGTDQKLFHLSRNKINKSSFLKGLIQGKFPYIMHPILHQMSPAEFEPVNAFLLRDEMPDSDLVSVYGDVTGDDDDHWEDVLGDVGKMGTYFKIKEVHNIDELKAYILQLGPTYAQACFLGLSEMADDVISNVQVAWNVYGRVDQLPIFLDFIEGILQNCARGSAPSAFHSIHQQSWTVQFLAETFVVCATEARQRFWSLMDKYPNLRAAVFKHRGVLDDAKLLNLEKKFMQREPLTEADFVIPSKLSEGVEQEAAVEDDGEGVEQLPEANERS